LIDYVLDAGGQVRSECSQRRMGRFGNLLHQAGHRISSEWKLPGQQLK
jgi:hypothetical protein